jgi:chemotaxis protein MotB
MMALFIVLWMMNASADVKRSISGYFQDPHGYGKSVGAGPANAGEGLRVDSKSMPDLRNMIEQALKEMPEFDKFRNNVKLSVTGEGLRIDLMENEQGLFFVTGSPDPSDYGKRLLNVLATEMTRIPNTIVVEGHTDTAPFRNATPVRGYTNWELSTDRANAARRVLCAGGIPAERIVEVRGFAEHIPLEGVDQQDSRNRRISIVVRLMNQAGASSDSSTASPNSSSATPKTGR